MFLFGEWSMVNGESEVSFIIDNKTKFEILAFTVFASTI
jgi:hypothetical protein